MLWNTNNTPSYTPHCWPRRSFPSYYLSDAPTVERAICHSAPPLSPYPSAFTSTSTIRFGADTRWRMHQARESGSSGLPVACLSSVDIRLSREPGNDSPRPAPAPRGRSSHLLFFFVPTGPTVALKKHTGFGLAFLSHESSPTVPAASRVPPQRHQAKPT